MGMVNSKKLLGGIPFSLKIMLTQFLANLVLSLALLQLLLGDSPTYVAVLGFVALGIEATLPIPQFISHYRNKSVAGFRPSVMIAWVLGDLFKTSYFFFGDANVTWQFKACAVVQISFDLGIALQFWIYGNRQPWTANEDEVKPIVEELEEGILRRYIDEKGIEWYGLIYTGVLN